MRSCCPGFLWKTGDEEHTNEEVECSLENEGFGGCIPWFSSRLHLPKGSDVESSSSLYAGAKSNLRDRVLGEVGKDSSIYVARQRRTP